MGIEERVIKGVVQPSENGKTVYVTSGLAFQETVREIPLENVDYIEYSSNRYLKSDAVHLKK